MNVSANGSLTFVSGQKKLLCKHPGFFPTLQLEHAETESDVRVPTFHLRDKTDGRWLETDSSVTSQPHTVWLVR